jgi:hypothetical protein
MESRTMRNLLLAALAAAAIGAVAFGDAEARFYTPQLEASSLVEEAACTVRRVRTVRPNGRVITRTIRRCTPEPRCRTVREVVRRDNGRIIFRTVRRCT